jgi:hypothetical protein
MKANCSLVAGLAIAASLCIATSAPAAYTITQSGPAAPSYSKLITFDEPGTPTGVVAKDWWANNLGLGVTIEDAVNANAVAISDPADAWLGSGNVAGGIFGIYQIVFTGNASSMSFQAWDSSGSPNPFGAGLRIVLLDANNNQLANQAFTGAWGGVGNTWFNVTTTNGDSFNKIAIFNNTSFNPTYIDNVSWNSVPSPGALALFSLAGLVRRGRRRA